MPVCPKCNKRLKDGSKFCSRCGTRIYETIHCPNCSKQITTEFAFCPNCGTAITNDLVEQKSDIKEPQKNEIKERQKKKLSKKHILFGGIGIAVIVTVAITAALLLLRKENRIKNYGVYIKDKEIFYTDFSQNNPLQITSSLFGVSEDNREITYNQYRTILADYIFLSEDGNVIFFIDKLYSESEGRSLYYRYLNKPDHEAVKIDSDVKSFLVNKKANLVTYLKEKDEGLYQYDMETGSKDKIDSNVFGFAISDDDKKIVYVNNDRDMYIKKFGKDKEKIDSNVDYTIDCINKGLSTVYYKKEGVLYKWIDGKGKEKIDTGVYYVLRIYDSGEIYYIKDNGGSSYARDYVEDDMKDSDALITEPERPSYPYWSEYDTTEEYQAAYEQYERDWDEYEEAYEKYKDKVFRDKIRYDLENTLIGYSNYILCYYNGTEAKIVSDALVYDDTNYSDDYDYAEDKPVMLFRKYNQVPFDKFKLSEISSAYEVQELINTTLYSSTELYFAMGDTTTKMEQNTADYFKFDKYGKTIYYIDNMTEGENYGDLYKITISDDKPQKPELYDRNVCKLIRDFTTDGDLIYFKNVKNTVGELYINKSRVDFGVYIYSYIYNSNFDRIVYQSDWDSERMCGTLKVHGNGKTVKVADNVGQFYFTPKGDIMYLHDYITNNQKGELYIYRKGKSEKIDDEVAAIVEMEFDINKYTQPVDWGE